MMRRSPVIAVSMVVFFLSLAGIPPTLGFAGKFYIFAAAIQSRSLALWCLAALGVANSVVSVYYYFNVTRTMFFNDPPEDEHLQLHPASFWAIATTAVASIVLLLLLNPVGRWAAANAWMSFTPR
jgi:NADH:ubiquinone oxidoreductase subunit 2 (subunit N)